MAKRVPVVQQLSASECGAACLAMVLGYYGKSVPLESVRDVCGDGRDGTNALTLLSAAELFGLRGRGVQIELDDIVYLETGAILHWEFDHYVVFEKRHRSSVEIVDPAVGRRTVPMNQFRKSFTGVVLVLEPGEGFEKTRARKSRLWATTREVLGRSKLLSRILVSSLLVQALALGVPLLIGQLVDNVIPRGDTHLLTLLFGGLAAMVLFQLLASLLRAHLLLSLRTLVDARLTVSFLDHLVSLPYSFFQTRPAGDLMMRLNSNSTVREILTSGALSGLLDGLLVILYLALLFAVNATMALTALGAGALTVVLLFAGRKRQRELAAQSLQVEAKSQSYEVEMLTAISTLKAMGAEQRAVSHWSRLFVDVLNVSIARGRLEALLDALTGAVRLGAPLCILSVGAHLVLSGRITLGAMLGLTALAGSFLEPLTNLVSTATQLQLLGGYLDRINDVFDTPPEQDRSEVRRSDRLAGRIALRNVSFRYSPLGPRAVENVSVDIAPRQFVAVVGRSGAGKSTLAGLLLGLFKPEEGEVRYDDVPLEALDLRALRRQVGIVTQEHSLFGGTIRDNIALADPSMPMDEVEAAARLAGIHDEISALPLGYQTPLVDRGQSLSGGQRQRIALARALARRPAIVLLDEATSALDAATESIVQRSLATLAATRIVIAHRLSTVRNADLILVMDAGKLVESGTHTELLAKRGAYARLIELQTDGTSSASAAG